MYYFEAWRVNYFETWIVNYFETWRVNYFETWRVNYFIYSTKYILLTAMKAFTDYFKQTLLNLGVPYNIHLTLC